MPIDYCADSPCFASSTCLLNVPPGPNEEPFTCKCAGAWYGPLCQCHPDLNPDGDACARQTEEEPAVVIASGIIVGIVLGIIFLIGNIYIPVSDLVLYPHSKKRGI